jgi:hypothetical protein
MDGYLALAASLVPLPRSWSRVPRNLKHQMSYKEYCIRNLNFMKIEGVTRSTGRVYSGTGTSTVRRYKELEKGAFERVQ